MSIFFVILQFFQLPRKINRSFRKAAVPVRQWAIHALHLVSLQCNYCLFCILNFNSFKIYNLNIFYLLGFLFGHVKAKPQSPTPRNIFRYFFCEFLNKNKKEAGKSNEWFRNCESERVSLERGCLGIYLYWIFIWHRTERSFLWPGSHLSCARGFLRFVYLCLEPSMQKHKPVTDTLGWM